MVESSFLLPLVLSLPLIHHLCIANEVYTSEEKAVLPLRRFQWEMHSGILSRFSRKSRRENGGTILEMKHRESWSGLTMNDWNEKLQKRLISDDIRVRSLQSRIKNKISGQIEDLSQSTQIPLNSGIMLQTLNYIVTVGLGGRNRTLIVDTGSDLTWVQCQPCKSCYNQHDPLFDPSKSPSYQSVSCNSPTCETLQITTGNSGFCGNSSNPSSSTCNYLVNYGDGSFTRGELAQDNLNLGTIPVDNFVFGCGEDNQGLFGGASGLMGLGRSKISLVSQTSGIFGGVFSYCLPSTDAEASGSLIFSGDYSVYKNSTPISFTRMVPNPQLSNFYFLNLTGISVGGVVLQRSGSGNGGILIDSGTVITRLAPSIYSAVKAEFVKQFSGFPTAPRFSILDTCFNLSGYQEVNVPTLRMHFEGTAELTVDVTGSFYFVKSDASQVCLAIASLLFEDETPIIGNYQQRNIRVVYDTRESNIGFAQEPCSFV